jgi:hypothetical protein
MSTEFFGIFHEFLRFQDETGREHPGGGVLSIRGL